MDRSKDVTLSYLMSGRDPNSAIERSFRGSRMYDKNLEGLILDYANPTYQDQLDLFRLKELKKTINELVYWMPLNLEDFNQANKDYIKYQKEFDKMPEPKDKDKLMERRLIDKKRQMKGVVYNGGIDMYDKSVEEYNELASRLGKEKIIKQEFTKVNYLVSPSIEDEKSTSFFNPSCLRDTGCTVSFSSRRPSKAKSKRRSRKSKRRSRKSKRRSRKSKRRSRKSKRRSRKSR
jgi:hypothetical protein